MDPGLSYPLACLGTRYHQDNYPKAIPHEQRVTALECLKNIGCRQKSTPKGDGRAKKCGDRVAT